MWGIALGLSELQTCQTPFEKILNQETRPLPLYYQGTRGGQEYKSHSIEKHYNTEASHSQISLALSVLLVLCMTRENQDCSIYLRSLWKPKVEVEIVFIILETLGNAIWPILSSAQQLMIVLNESRNKSAFPDLDATNVILLGPTHYCICRHILHILSPRRHFNEGCLLHSPYYRFYAFKKIIYNLVGKLLVKQLLFLFVI